VCLPELLTLLFLLISQFQRLSSNILSFGMGCYSRRSRLSRGAAVAVFMIIIIRMLLSLNEIPLTTPLPSFIGTGRWNPISISEIKMVENSSSDDDVESRVIRRQRQYLEGLRGMNVTSVKDTWGPDSVKHDLGMTLKRSDPLDSLLYITIPKAGSRTMKTALSTDPSGLTFDRKQFLHKLNTSEYLTFSVVRHPEERIASAYSTIVTRFSGFGKRGRKTLPNIPTPTMGDDIESWREHFQKTMYLWMKTVRDCGWNNTRCRWNEHLIPQIEFVRGYDLRLIGCLDSIEDTFSRINVSLNQTQMNTYQHKDGMPSEKFQSFDLLFNDTKTLIRELYKEDYDLFHTFCGDDTR
jgi:hypothetical protein